MINGTPIESELTDIVILEIPMEIVGGGWVMKTAADKDNHMAYFCRDTQNNQFWVYGENVTVIRPEPPGLLIIRPGDGT